MKDISYTFILVRDKDLDLFLQASSAQQLSGVGEVFRSGNKVDFSQEPSVSDSGTLWNQTFRGVTACGCARRWNGRRAGVAIVNSDGSITKIGNSGELPTITVTPYYGAFVVSATFDTAVPAAL